MRDRLALALVLGAVMLALGGTACGERSEPTGATVRLYPVTVSRSGAPPIVLDSEPPRVAAVTPPAVGVVHALVGGKGERPAVLDQPDKIDVDELRSFKPALIVASAQADQTELEQASRATKAPVYVFPGDSIGDVEHGITDLGLLLGRELKARKLVGEIESPRRFVQKRVAKLKKPSVFVDTGFFVTVPPNSLTGQLVDEAGGHNVAGINVSASPFDLGRLARLNPDVYLATSDSGTTLRDLRKGPRTRKLKAVRNGRFAIVQARLLEPGPRIGAGLLVIARVLHPGALEAAPALPTSP